MSEPLTVTELDAQTREELQPPCDVRQGQPSGSHAPACDSPAEWVVAVTSKCISPAKIRLYCGEHTAALVAGALKCLGCGEYGARRDRLRAVSVERL